MSWYDELLEYQFDWLRNNKTPFGLCNEWKQAVFREMQKEKEKGMQSYYPDYWVDCGEWGAIYKGSTYRLNPDWRRPEEQPEQPEKKEGRWEYCEVYNDAGAYRFTLSNGVDHYLFFAFNLSGFGGIEFEEKPDIWCCGLMLWVSAFQLLAAGVEGAKADVKDARPATPKRVRFWVD